MTKVAGKVAFITGGGSGVGFGQAAVFADIVPFHFDHPVTGKPIRIDNSRAREGFDNEK